MGLRRFSRISSWWEREPPVLVPIGRPDGPFAQGILAHGPARRPLWVQSALPVGPVAGMRRLGGRTWEPFLARGSIRACSPPRMPPSGGRRSRRPSSRIGRAARPSRDRIREVWDRRELALVLAGREVTARYRQAAFGIAWAVIQPSRRQSSSRRSSDGGGLPSDGLPYAVFLFAGLVAWTYFASERGERHRSWWTTRSGHEGLLPPLARSRFRGGCRPHRRAVSLPILAV